MYENETSSKSYNSFDMVVGLKILCALKHSLFSGPIGTLKYKVPFLARTRIFG